MYSSPAYYCPTYSNPVFEASFARCSCAPIIVIPYQYWNPATQHSFTNHTTIVISHLFPFLLQFTSNVFLPSTSNGYPYIWSSNPPQQFRSASRCGGPYQCNKVHPWGQQVDVIQLTGRTILADDPILIGIGSLAVSERSILGETQDEGDGSGRRIWTRSLLDNFRNRQAFTENIKCYQHIPINRPQMFLQLSWL